MMKKKSQIFLFDLILSVTILIVSIGLIAVYYSNTIKNDDIYSSNLNFIQSFSKTKINSLNNDEIRLYFTQSKIRNIENTLAQQVSEFHYRGFNEDSINLTRIIARDFFSSQMNVEIYLIDSGGSYLLFNQTRREKSQASIVSVFQRDVIGFFEGSPYGPYTIVSEVWI